MDRTRLGFNLSLVSLHNKNISHCHLDTPSVEASPSTTPAGHATGLLVLHSFLFLLFLFGSCLLRVCAGLGSVELSSIPSFDTDVEHVLSALVLEDSVDQPRTTIGT